MKKINHYVATLALLVASAAPANANIVENSGFESGSSGWASNGWGFGSTGRGIHSGSAGIYTGCTDPEFSCQFGQMLSTVAGQRYDLSFWLYTDGFVRYGESLSEFSNGLQVSFDGAVVSTMRDFPTTNTGDDWMPGGPSTRIFIKDLLATSAWTYLGFAGYHGPAAIYVDDISVVEAAARDVAEPGTLVLGGLALAGLFAARCRRSQPRAK